MTVRLERDSGVWEVVIGLEVHAQITAKAKLFSQAPTTFGAAPNTQVSFIDAGFPGMLPVLNPFCIAQALKTGLGLNGTINPVSVFDRKNYFYPDLPQGYQISQFYRPIMEHGFLSIENEAGETRKIGITRLHIEQDAGKSIHDMDPTRTYVDLNRAGVALMEIVSEPEIRTAQEASAYVKKLRTILRYLGTCDGNMEKGNLRVDANVSVRHPGEPMGTRAEIKNLNSMRFLQSAINYEIERQITALENGETSIQETRLYDTQEGVTRSMRNKENAQDYRYFQDPDIPPVYLDEATIERARGNLPELPDQKKARFTAEFDLTPYDASILTEEKETARFFEEAVMLSRRPSPRTPKKIANWITGELFAALNRSDRGIAASPLTPRHIAQLVDAVEEGTISGKIAKTLFEEIFETPAYPEDLIEGRGLKQNSNVEELTKTIEALLEKEEDKVNEFLSGKDKIFGYFVGQVMKMMGGKGNPALINEILKAALKKRSG